LSQDISGAKTDAINRINSAVEPVVQAQQNLAVELEVSKRELSNQVLQSVTPLQVTTAKLSTAIEATKQDVSLVSQTIAPLQKTASDLKADITATKQDVAKKVEEVKLISAQQTSGVKDLLKTSTNNQSASFTNDLHKTKQEVSMCTDSKISVVNRNLNQVSAQQNFISSIQVALGQFFSANAALILDSAAEDVSAALLNAAAAGTYSKEFTCTLAYLNSEDAYEGPHAWASFGPVVTPHVTADDEQIGVPVIKWADDETLDPAFAYGVLNLKVIFDTDAGATKTYISGDSVTCDVQVAADNKWFGLTIAMVTKTYNVVA
jgi:hypothetical protein